MSTDVDLCNLLGRVEPPPRGPSLQVFGQIATGTGIAQDLRPQRDPVLGAGQVYGARSASMRMRRIRTSGIQVTRESAQTPVRPLARDQITAEDGSRRTPNFSLLVSASTPEGFTQFRMDAGETLDMLCGAVNISVCGPQGSVLVPGTGGAEIDPVAGIIGDALIGMSVSCIESAAGTHSRVIFSEIYRLPANVATAIPVPSYARACKAEIVYRAGLGGGPSSEWYFTADPAGALRVGRLEWNGGATASTDETEDCGTASFLLTDILNDGEQSGDRVVALFWQIEP